jgi:hypothetical protein
VAAGSIRSVDGREEVMALSPLVQALDHFSLAQLMADPNLCRNVLNDMGAQPSEVFLLVAALEARIPQTLLEHTATNDLSVVEPRLVTELNQRGVERSRAEWAVNAWKEVVGGSSLAQETVIRPSSPGARPTEPLAFGAGEAATVRPSEPATVRPSQPAAALSSEPATVRPSEPATVRSTAPAPALAQAPPPPPPSAAASSTPPPSAGERRSRKGSILAAAVIVVLVAAVVALLVTRPSDKHDAASSTSSTASQSSAASTPASSSAPATTSSAPPSSATAPANLNAPLGAAKAITVQGASAWTDTGLKVTAGERINITASGQIMAGPGQPCGPDGIAQVSADIYTLIGGGHVAALIGLVAGSDKPFLVGSTYNDVAPAPVPSPIEVEPGRVEQRNLWLIRAISRDYC